MKKCSKKSFLTILPQISTLLYNKWIDKTLNMNWISEKFVNKFIAQRKHLFQQYYTK